MRELPPALTFGAGKLELVVVDAFAGVTERFNGDFLYGMDLHVLFITALVRDDAATQ